MARFIKVATVTEIPPGTKKIVEADGTLIVVANIMASSTPSRMFAPTTAVRWARASLRDASSFVRATALASMCAPAPPSRCPPLSRRRHMRCACRMAT